jgi:hypothetical protein
MPQLPAIVPVALTVKLSALAEAGKNADPQTSADIMPKNFGRPTRVKMVIPPVRS